jgi:hypothetical protein
MRIKLFDFIYIRRAATNSFYFYCKNMFVLLSILYRFSILPFFYFSIAFSACITIACHRSACCFAVVFVLKMSVCRSTDFFAGAAREVTQEACSSSVLRLHFD